MTYCFTLLAAIISVILAGYSTHLAAISLKGRKRNKAIVITRSLAGLIMIMTTCQIYSVYKSDMSQKEEQKKRDELAEKNYDTLEKMLENLSRKPIALSRLTAAWGKISTVAPTIATADMSTQNDLVFFQPQLRIDPERLGLDMRRYGSAAATVVNDGTNQAGNFAKQLEIGLRMGGWTVGGDNIKMGDPEFFPDGVTIEVSSTPSARTDHSREHAKELIEELKKQGVVAILRFTDLKFPENFLRIKVAGK
jgi:hypothetical protein